MLWGPLLLLRDSVSGLSRLILPQAGKEYLPLTEKLIRAFKDQHGRDPGSGDVDSWENSLPVVIGALMELGRDTVEVFIEFRLPHTNSAVDVLLAGQRPGNVGFSYVAVELKQVRRAVVHPECSIAVDLGYRDEYKLHPVRQVQRYCEFMTRYLVPLNNDPGQLVGAALLHNACDEDVKTLSALPVNEFGRLYTSSDLQPFRTLLMSRLAAAPGGDAAQILVKANQSPLEKVTDISRHRPVQKAGLVLLDEQEIAFDWVSRTVEELLEDAGSHRAKRVFIIRGGPGSGKSAVALRLREQLAQRGYAARLASGSNAYTRTLREIMVSRARRGEVGKLSEAARSAYPYFNQFGEAEPNSVDVLICDESHRIRKTSTDRYTKRALREQERPQADELMAAARVPVFLLDDHQSLRPDEVGTTAYLSRHAAGCGYETKVVDLDGKFRGGGSERYQRWVQRLLGLDEADPEAWQPDGRVQLLVAESPEQLEQFILARQAELGELGSARITAGFCWPWNSPKQGALPLDVQIGDWHRPWNVKGNQKLRDAPPAALWSTDRRGIGQIGCVYTAQTFEYDWSGVILGPDLVWRGSGFTVQRSATRDQDLKQKKVSDEDVDRCVRNAYHVLLTRGVAGNIVYSTDAETRDVLRKLIQGGIGSAPRSKGDSVAPLTAEGNPIPKIYRSK